LFYSLSPWREIDRVRGMFRIYCSPPLILSLSKNLGGGGYSISLRLGV
jgi:hypothetical protein